MPRSAAQNQAIRTATRAAIVAAALAQFARYGYAATSIRQIAAAAEISTGLMYHYFPSKEQLLQAVYDHCMARLEFACIAAQDHPDPAACLSRLLRALFDLLKADPDFWALFYMLRTQPAILAVVGDALRAATVHLRDLIAADLAALGRADPALDALLLYSLVEGTIQQYLLDPAAYPLDRVADRIIAEYGTVVHSSVHPFVQAKENTHV